MASTLILLSVLLFCQIVWVLACLGYGGGRGPSYETEEDPGPGFAGEDPPTWAIFKGQQGKPDYCFMDPDAGNCKETLLRWSFNATAKKCVQFQYSGCDGNFNNFKLKRKCEDLCLHDPQSNCQKHQEYLTYDVNDTTYLYV